MSTLSDSASLALSEACSDKSPGVLGIIPLSASSVPAQTAFPLRPAWIEIDLRKLKRNFELIHQDKPSGLQVLAVVKDEGYGHGAEPVARTAVACGASFLALTTLEEAVTLRDDGLQCRMLLLGDRQESELPWCVAHDLTCCLSEAWSV